MVLCLASLEAHAYDKETHQELTELAWEAIRAGSDSALSARLQTHYRALLNNNALVFSRPELNTVPSACLSGGSANPCGKNVTAAEWTTFVTGLRSTITRFGNLQANVPRVHSTSVCPLAPTTTTTGTQTLSQVVQPVSPLYPGFGALVPSGFGFDKSEEMKCGIDRFWRHGGIYDHVRMPSGIDEQAGLHGTVLGRMAKGADDRKEDTSLRMSISNTRLANYFDDGVAVGAVAFVAPIVCFASWLFGGPDCGSIIRSIRDGARPIDQLAGLSPFDACDAPLIGDVPVLCNTRAEAYIGFWHHINLNPASATADNPVFDDKGGLYFPHAGPAGVPGLADDVLSSLMDELGATINYDESAGPKLYQIENGNDDHDDTTMRTKKAWERENASMTMMEPLDNLAMHGWQRFLTSPSADDLLWPLHALQDATVPQHVAPSAGFGHTPYEHAVARNLPAVLFRPCLPGRANHHAICPRSVEGATANPLSDGRAQFDQTQRILAHAFKWRQFIVAQRVSPNPTNYVPVRDLVTALGQETRNSADFNTIVSTTGDICSVMEEFGPAAVAVGPANPCPNPIGHYSTSSMVTIMRGHVERSAGAQVAFLMSAAELLPSTAPPAPACRAAGQSCTATLTSSSVSTTCCDSVAQAPSGTSGAQRLERSACVPTTFSSNPPLNTAIGGTCLPTICRECNQLVAQTSSGTCPSGSTRVFLGETRAACRCGCGLPVD
jgi:hypothetical protein